MTKLPDFFFIGAAKSGTISIYHYLAQHPDIFMCPVNECNFFALETADWEREYRGPVDRTHIDQYCIKTLEGYSALFRQARPGQMVGESSPLYLFSCPAAERIRYYTPQAKIIAILRQPVDRAFSNYCDLRRSGLEPFTDFRQAIRAETNRRSEGWGPWPFWYYTEMGFYARQLKPYYENFGSDRVFVALYEDLCGDPVQLMKSIYRFVGVDSSYTLDMSTRHNLGGIPRKEWMHRFMTRPSLPKAIFKKMIPNPLRHQIRDLLSDWNTIRPRLDPLVRQELNRMYREDIHALENLIGRDLSHWL